MNFKTIFYTQFSIVWRWLDEEKLFSQLSLWLWLTRKLYLLQYFRKLQIWHAHAHTRTVRIRTQAGRQAHTHTRFPEFRLIIKRQSKSQRIASKTAKQQSSNDSGKRSGARTALGKSQQRENRQSSRSSRKLLFRSWKTEKPGKPKRNDQKAEPTRARPMRMRRSRKAGKVCGGNRRGKNLQRSNRNIEFSVLSVSVTMEWPCCSVLHQDASRVAGLISVKATYKFGTNQTNSLSGQLICKRHAHQTRAQAERGYIPLYIYIYSSSSSSLSSPSTQTHLSSQEVGQKRNQKTKRKYFGALHPVVGWGVLRLSSCSLGVRLCVCQSVCVCVCEYGSLFLINVNWVSFGAATKNIIYAAFDFPPLICRDVFRL